MEEPGRRRRNVGGGGGGRRRAGAIAAKVPGSGIGRPRAEAVAELDAEEDRLVKMGWSPKGGLTEERSAGPGGGGKAAPLDRIAAEKEELVRVLRVIMNLVPVNVFMREITGDVGALPWVGAWAHIVLMKGVVMLLYAEDQRVMFYRYLLPRQWRRWFVFERAVSEHWVGGRSSRKVWLRSRVVPMGWILAVTLAQHVHRNQMIWTGPGAGLDAGEEWRKDRMVPLILNVLKYMNGSENTIHHVI